MMHDEDDLPSKLWNSGRKRSPLGERPSFK